MEGIPTLERKIDKIDLIKGIELLGIDDPEVKANIREWVIQQEKIIQEGPSKTSWINFNMGRVDLYITAGDIDRAWDTLNDIREQAYNQNEMELYDEVNTKMDEIKDL